VSIILAPHIDYHLSSDFVLVLLDLFVWSLQPVYNTKPIDGIVDEFLVVACPEE